MAKASAREKVMMVSTGKNQKGKPTRYSKTTYKNKRNTEKKLSLKKYDPRAWDPVRQKLGVCVVFEEKKVPK